jgi:tetratricopeptide (TPR) repeat protein
VKRASEVHRANLPSSLRGIAAALCLIGGIGTVAVSSAQEAPAATPPTDESGKLPDNTLTRETLFKLMMSEIAAQRGATDASFATEYKLAKDTKDPRIARRAVEFAVQARQPAQAIEAARLWTELAPGSQTANDTYLTLLILAGRYEDAEPLLAAKIEGAPSKSSALAQVYGLLAQGQRRPEVYALTRKLADRYPALPESHMIVAQAAAAAGDKPGAVIEARVAVKLQPDSEPATIMLAQLQQFDAPKEADAVLASYIAHNPKSTTVRIAYARFLNGEKRFDEASAQLARVRRDAANNPDTIYTLGLLAYQANKPKDSEAYFKHFIELTAGPKAKAAPAPQADDDDDSDTASEAPAEPPARGPDRAYLYLAQIAEDQKDYPRALDWLGKVGDGPQFAMAHIRRALILAHQGKLDVARTELHALPSGTPAQQTEITLAEAQMLRDADQSQAAFDLLAGAVEKTPNNPDLLYDYGMTAEKLNRIDVLENAMRSVMKVRPDNAQAYNALGYTLADRNERLDEAKALIDKANALAPDDASILDSLGWVEYRLGNNSDALVNLQKAYKLRDDAEIAVHLGEVLWVSGKPAEAEKAWADAKAKEPTNETLKATLTRFNVTIGKR